MLRKALSCLATLGVAALAVPGIASATPVVTFKARAVPIAGFPNTGNILGAGAAVKFEWTIKGTEYGGFPAAADRRQHLLPQGNGDQLQRLCVVFADVTQKSRPEVHVPPASRLTTSG